VDPLTSRSSTSPPGELGPGLYVHVPFCTRRCGYCDFSIVVGAPRGRDAFVHDVLTEADLHLADADGANSFGSDRFATLSLGGGTPSLLSTEELTALFGGLRSRFPFVDAPEISLECNPESLEPEKIEALLASGVTRFSIGVQSLDPAELALLDRAHQPEQVATLFRTLRAAGARDVSLDLIFGLPGQSLATWTTTVENAIALAPDHVSAYLLTLEGKAPLLKRLPGGARALPPEELVAEQYALLQERLSAAGLEQYEVSNFARAGHESRHNANYWMRGDYLALGPAAHAHRSGRRWSNAIFPKWRARLAAGELPIESVEALTPQEVVEESIFLPLRTRWGIGWDQLAGMLTAEQVERLRGKAEELGAAGFVDVGERLRLRAGAYLISNAIFSELLGVIGEEGNWVTQGVTQ